MDFKEQIIQAIKEPSEPKIEDLIGSKPTVQDSSIVKELNVFELLTYLYHSRSRREDSNHELILMPELWTEEDGLDEVLDEFVNNFGRKTAIIIINNIMDSMGIPNEDGLTEDEIAEILHLASIEMVVMNICNTNVLKALLSNSGEISWIKIAEF